MLKKSTRKTAAAAAIIEEGKIKLLNLVKALDLYRS
jgi:hypothetical protein